MSRRGQQNLHPVRVVASRTGLSPDVIRSWERRHDAVNPIRSTTGRRLYTDEDVERIKLLRRATLSGRRIGDVAHLAVEELASLVDEDLDAAVAAGSREKGPYDTNATSRCLQEGIRSARTTDTRTNPDDRRWTRFIRVRQPTRQPRHRGAR